MIRGKFVVVMCPRLRVSLLLCGLSTQRRSSFGRGRHKVAGGEKVDLGAAPLGEKTVGQQRWHRPSLWELPGQPRVLALAGAPGAVVATFDGTLRHALRTPRQSPPSLLNLKPPRIIGNSKPRDGSEPAPMPATGATRRRISARSDTCRRMAEDMALRNLSPNTQASYIGQVSLFARHFGKSPDLLGPQQIRDYQLFLTTEKQLAPGSIRVAVSALHFLYGVILTTYAVLAQLEELGIGFLTLHRRSPKVVRELLANEDWKRVTLHNIGRQHRHPRVLDQTVKLRGYPASIRQLAITELGPERPTLLLTNQLQARAADLIDRYARRMVIENAIAESIDFFRTDALSSEVPLKIDADLQFTMMAGTLYRLLARRIGHGH